MGFLAGKRYLIVGIASTKSIAWGIAEAMHREGAELAFTYQNDKLKTRVEKAANAFGGRPELCFPCDVASDAEIEAVFSALGQHWDGLDGIVHAVGFAPASELDGNFVEVATREGFHIAHDISSYSFVALAKAGHAMMQGRNGSLLTLSYHASQQTVPNYNVMGMAKASLEASVRYLAASLGPEGIRVNAVRPGLIETDIHALAGAPDRVDRLMSGVPMGRAGSAEEVARTILWLAGPDSSYVSGALLDVSGGR